MAQPWPYDVARGPMPREARVQDACRDWLQRLDDMVRQSNLVRWRDAGEIAFDLRAADQAALEALLDGGPVALARLVRLERDSEIERLRSLHDRVLEGREEHGVETLHLAFGMATWQPADGTQVPRAPVILLPVTLDDPHRAGSIRIRRRGAMAVNPALAHVLDRDHHCAVDSIEMPDGTKVRGAELPAALWAPLVRAARSVPGFAVEHSVLLGNFFPHRVHLLRELAGRAGSMAGHDVLAALAGDSEAKEALRATAVEAGTRPARIVLPADRSQIEAIEAARRGHSCAIVGGPGTGKSQTIANLRAALIADGQRVLVVASKRAALEAVRTRLEARGLGEMVLDLGDAEIDGQKVRRRIAAAARSVPAEGGAEPGELAQIGQRRQRLQATLDVLLRARPPAGLSVFDLQSRIMRVPQEVRAAGLEPWPELRAMDLQAVRDVKILLAELSTFAATRSAWTGAAIPDATAAREAVGLSLRAYEGWQQLRAALAAVDPGARPRTFSELSVLVQEWPKASPEAVALETAIDSLRLPLLKLQALMGPAALRSDALDEMGRSLAALAGDQTTPHRIPQVRALQEELTLRGVSRAVQEMQDRGVPSSLWPQAFELLWLEACLADVRRDVATLPGIYGRDRDALEREMDELEEQERSAASVALRWNQKHRVRTAFGDRPEQQRLLQAAADAGAPPLPELLAAAPDALLTVFPCWLVSPFTVSQMVDGSRTHFDVVIWDESSQMPVEAAILAILRGARLVLAGDENQLPPPEAADPAARRQPQSLLEALSFLPRYSLGWHYRSLDEALFAFANRRIYHGAVATFPGRLGHGAGLRHVRLDQPDTSRSRAGDAALAGLVDLVLREAKAHPQESLGVIALTSAEADRIRGAVYAAVSGLPDLQPFFATSRSERFFVKPVDLVQGDERDHVIFAVGVDSGQADGAAVDLLWGPLGERRLNVAITRARRRMTVATALGGEEIRDLGLGGGVALLRDFLQYAKMRHGGRMAGELSDEPVNPFEDTLAPFPEEVYVALREAGMDVVPQYGALRHRFDLVARHPGRPSEYVLAIACDGCDAHGMPTMREHDRQRQLEHLGWRYHRIWSGDWAADRDREIARAVEACRVAAASIDGG